MSIKESIERLQSEVDQLRVTAENTGPCEYGTLSFTLPLAYKHKYDQIQIESNKKFSKLLLDIIKKSIDSVG